MLCWALSPSMCVLSSIYCSCAVFLEVEPDLWGHILSCFLWLLSKLTFTTPCLELEASSPLHYVVMIIKWNFGNLSPVGLLNRHLNSMLMWASPKLEQSLLNVQGSTSNCRAGRLLFPQIAHSSWSRIFVASPSHGTSHMHYLSVCLCQCICKPSSPYDSDGAFLVSYN